MQPSCLSFTTDGLILFGDCLHFLDLLFFLFSFWSLFCITTS